jgi:hypothetical protein
MSSPSNDTSKNSKKLEDESEEAETEEEESIDQILLRYANEFSKTKTANTSSTSTATSETSNLKPSKKINLVPIIVAYLLYFGPHISMYLRYFNRNF